MRTITVRIVAGFALIAAAPPPPASLADWLVEAESPKARVTERDGVIDIDTPQGLTLWARAGVSAPVIIRFEAMAVSGGGPNDHVSDLNAFWMATNRDASSAPSRRRSGAFAAYDDLKTYYVGIGGNRNTTTRFRRYIGVAGNRPIRPEHDLAARSEMLVPNRWTKIALIADGRTIAVDRDGRRVFTLIDDAPYTHGHWGLRTTANHLRIRRVRVTS